MKDYLYVYNGKQIAPSSGKVLGVKAPAVPEKTIRFKFSNNSFNPVTDTYSYTSSTDWHWTPISPVLGIYDFTCSLSDWTIKIQGTDNTILNDVTSANIRYPMNNTSNVGSTEILDSNLSGVNSVDRLFHAVRNTLSKVTLHKTSSLTSGYNWGNSSGVTVTEIYIEDTSNMENMASMFNGCKYLTSINPLCTDKCTNTASMFSGCNALPAFTLSSLSLVTNASSMFNNCYAITTLGNLDLPACTSISGMFSNCRNLTSIGDINIPLCTSTNSLFSGRDALTTVGRINMPACTDATAMFQGCTSMVTAPTITTTSALQQVGSMFARCFALETIPLFNTSGVTKFFGGSRGGICYQCTALKTVPLFDTSSATDVRSMFNSCSAVESGALALYQQMSTQATPPSSYGSCFTNCGANTVSGAAELAQIPTSWGGTMAE